MKERVMAERTRMVRRLWRPRTIVGIGLPVILALVVTNIDKRRDDLLHGWPAAFTLSAHVALVLVAALLAIYAVRVFVQAVNDFLDDYLGLGRSRSLATFTSVILYAIIVLLVISAIGPNLNGVLVGGALTGVVVGIAGQASLSNIIAGLVILFARPYSAGMFVTARTGIFGGVEYSGQVWDISLFYTTLHTNELEVRIPNNAMINAVVVRRPREYEVAIPVTLPKATEDVPGVMDRLRAAVVERSKGEVAARVTLDSVTDVGYVVGIRAFVSDDMERRLVEAGVAHVVEDVVSTVAAAQREIDVSQAAGSKDKDEDEDRTLAEERGERTSVASRAG